MGRPRSPTHRLRVQGTYREDYHGDRREPKAHGKPRKPRGLPVEAGKHWDEVVGNACWLAAADEHALQQMCIWWATIKELRKIPKAKRSGKYIYELSCADKAWRTYASKLGLTPVDRASLSVPDEEKRDPLDELIA